jgi:hypothetical protein
MKQTVRLKSREDLHELQHNITDRYAVWVQVFPAMTAVFSLAGLSTGGALFHDHSINLDVVNKTGTVFLWTINH